MNNLFKSAVVLSALLLAGNTLKAQIDDKRGIVAKGAQLEKVKDGFSFTEGPAVNRQGDIFFTDQPNDKIYRWNPNSNQITLFKEGAGRSNGLYFQLDGKLIAAADLNNEFACRHAPTGGKCQAEVFGVRPSARNIPRIPRTA